MTNGEAKALVNTIGSSKREVDFETLSNTLIKVQALLSLTH